MIEVRDIPPPPILERSLANAEWCMAMATLWEGYARQVTPENSATCLNEAATWKHQAWQAHADAVGFAAWSLGETVRP